MDASRTVTVYGIANCDKVRAVLTWCRRNGVACVLHDYRRDGLDEALISELTHHFSLNEVVNTRSVTWRRLDEQRRRNLDAAILRQHPTLIKRPIVRVGDRWLLGASTDQLAGVLL